MAYYNYDSSDTEEWPEVRYRRLAAQRQQILGIPPPVLTPTQVLQGSTDLAANQQALLGVLQSQQANNLQEPTTTTSSFSNNPYYNPHYNQSQGYDREHDRVHDREHFVPTNCQQNVPHSSMTDRTARNFNTYYTIKAAGGTKNILPGRMTRGNPAEQPTQTYWGVPIGTRDTPRFGKWRRDYQGGDLDNGGVALRAGRSWRHLFQQPFFARRMGTSGPSAAGRPTRGSTPPALFPAAARAGTLLRARIPPR